MKSLPRPSLFLATLAALALSAAWPGAAPLTVAAEPGAAIVAPTDWRLAQPGWQYRFPADHAAHRDFKTEWWYFTGQVRDEASGREYGYELTFFRQGVIPPGRRAEPPAPAVPTGDAPARSRFVQDDFKFAHLAVTDLAGRRFLFTQKATRGAFGEAGFTAQAAEDPRLAWIEGWELRAEPDGAWRIVARATNPDIALDLRVMPTRPPTIHGIPGEGISRKGAEDGNASHYYSFTRMATTGTLALGGKAPLTVRGESWFDHEWASNGLGPEQIGWDWFSLQFEDGAELMLYAMRRRDGTIDALSSGTFVTADGSVRHLRREDFSLKAAGTPWRSPRTGAVYPLGWQVEIPALGLAFTTSPRLNEQELALPQLAYWEGAITAAGTREGREVRGRGYMELTGYAGPLVGLGR